jgi:hypothetical protein
VKSIKALLSVILCMLFSVNFVLAAEAQPTEYVYFNEPEVLSKQDYLLNLTEPEVQEHIVKMYSERAGTEKIEFREKSRDVVFYEDGSAGTFVIYDVYGDGEFIEEYGDIYPVSPKNEKFIPVVQHSMTYNEDSIAEVHVMLDDYFGTEEPEPEKAPVKLNINKDIIVIGAIALSIIVLLTAIILVMRKKRRS